MDERYYEIDIDMWQCEWIAKLSPAEFKRQLIMAMRGEECDLSDFVRGPFPDQRSDERDAL